MKKIGFLITIVLLVLSCDKEKDEDIPVAENYNIYTLETSKGNISLYLYENTPVHKKNFDSLCKSGFYDGVIFHRVIDNFMIQGGDPDGTGRGGPGYTLPAEIKGEYPHIHGALAAARIGGTSNPDKRSSGSQFYIVENSNGYPSLNNNYTVFGETVAGLDVVSTIAEVPTGAVSKDRPNEDVVINKVSIKTYAAEEIKSTFGLSVPK